MGYINENVILGYIDLRMKRENIPEEGVKELKLLASLLISTPPEKVRKDEISEVRSAVVNRKVELHYCSSCRTLVKEGDVFCSKCGRRLQWQ